jgi:hypothetical protein
VAETRVWRDVRGKQNNGKFVRIHDGNVILARASGRVFEVPYKSLSRDDQQYVRGLLAARGESHLCPPLSDDNPEPDGNGLVAAPAATEFPDAAPELTGPTVAGRTPLHDQTRSRFGLPEVSVNASPDGESSAQPTAPGKLDVVALQPTTEPAPASRMPWPELPKLNGKQIRALIIVSIVRVIVGSILGSVILRTAIYLFNAITATGDSRDAVPEPTYGEGVGIIFVTIIVNSVAACAALFAIAFGCALAGVEEQHARIYAPIAVLPLGVLIMSGMFSSLLPTTYLRALVIAIGYMVIWIFIVAAILIGIFAFGFRMS